MRVDALQVTQHVEVQRTGLKTFEKTAAQPLQMPLGRALLHMTHVYLYLDEMARKVGIARDEYGLGDAQIIDGEIEKALQLLIAFLGESQPPPSPFWRSARKGPFR